MNFIIIDYNSLYEYFRDTIILCNMALNNDSFENKDLARDLLVRFKLRSDMLSRLDMPGEERKFWERIKELF